MFRYYSNLYIGSTVSHVDRIKSMLSEQTSIYDVYLLCVNESSHHLMEIFHSPQLLKDRTFQKDYVIVGIANGKSEAKELFAKVLRDYLLKNQKLDLFKNKFLNDMED